MPEEEVLREGEDGIYQLLLEDPELLAICEEIEEHREAHAKYKSALERRKTRVRALEDHIKESVSARRFNRDGADLVIGGRFTLRTKMREGGERTMKAWKRIAVTSQKLIPG